MNIRPADFLLLGTLLLLAGWPRPLLASAPATETVVRVHWRGMQQISTDTNAANFMSVWQLPQTTTLLAQTFDKLSRWPGHGATNAVSTRLRPLLDDLVASEFYLEVSAGTNAQPPTLNSQLLFAIRLPAGRAGFWQTNLAAAIEARTGIQPVSTCHGWMIARSPASNRIEFALAGEWTIVGCWPGTNIAQTEFSTRLLQAKSPDTNWLEADLDLPRLCSSLSACPTGGEGRGEVGSLFLFLPVPSSLSQLHLSVCAESNHVLSRVTLNFNSALASPLPAWDIPTNLIHGPLTSFTAMRGMGSWLSGLPAWQELRLNPPPDQAFFWAQEGVPFMTYFTAPLPDASNHLTRLAVFLVQKGNPWLATHGAGSFQWQTNPPGLTLSEVPILLPFLKSVHLNQQEYVVGGLCPSATNASPPSVEFLKPVFNGSDELVYYQTEQTGQRIADGMFNNQLLRLIFHRSQLPGNSTSALWLKNAGPSLGDSTTVVTRVDPHQFSFTRHSTVGLTALELHLLADWLESPRFPSGMYSQ